MIEIRLRAPSERREPRLYRVAERPLAVDRPLPELEAFAAAGGRCGRGSGGRPPGGGEELVFRGAAEIGRARRAVDCRFGAAGYRLAVAGVGRFTVAADGGRIVRQPAAGSRDREDPADEDLVETVLGPGLILALALQDVWCLHASAVEIGGRAVAFVGASGAGKSTLARALPELVPAPRLRRVADDVLPLALAAGEARVLPHFPQLKDDPGEQPGATVAGSLPLAAVYLLDAGAAPGVTVEPLHGFAAALALVRHTVAARLFTAELLRRHSEFCARLAGLVPVRRLRYPKSWNSLPRIAEALRLEPKTRESQAPSVGRLT